MCDCKSPRVKFTVRGRDLPCIYNYLYLTPDVTIQSVLGVLYQIVPSDSARMDMVVRDCKGHIKRRLNELSKNTRLARVKELRRNGSQITVTVS